MVLIPLIYCKTLLCAQGRRAALAGVGGRPIIALPYKPSRAILKLSDKRRLSPWPRTHHIYPRDEPMTTDVLSAPRTTTSALSATLQKVLLFSMTIGLLWVLARINYLLFHSVVEIVSIVIAFALFAISWNSRTHSRNGYVIFIGIAYFCIGVLDLLHTLTYVGMPLHEGEHFYANQLWVAARAMEGF